MKHVFGFPWFENFTEAPNSKEIKGGTFTSEENCCWKILPAFLILMRIAKPSSFFRAWTDQHPLMYIYVSSKSTNLSFFCLFDLTQMEKQLRFAPQLIFTSLQSKRKLLHNTSFFEDARHQIGIKINAWAQNLIGHPSGLECTSIFIERRRRRPGMLEASFIIITTTCLSIR